MFPAYHKLNCNAQLPLTNLSFMDTYSATQPRMSIDQGKVMASEHIGHRLNRSKYLFPKYCNGAINLILTAINDDKFLKKMIKKYLQLYVVHKNNIFFKYFLLTNSKKILTIK